MKIQACLTIFGSLALFSATSAVHIKRHHAELEGEDWIQSIPHILARDPTALPEHWFDQKIDHFARKTSVFKQRYFVNSTYFKPGGPVYLYSPGEGPARPVGGGQLRNLAEATHGLMVSLEHRYYGKSLPTAKSTFEGMKYLTVDQGLADFANFIKKFKYQGVTAKTKWALVGGSYAGAQASWGRQKYPELIHAALASSGPVQAKADFYEYDLTLTEAIPCAEHLHQVTKYIDSVLDKGNKKDILKIKTAFGLQNITDNADFAFAYTDILSGLVQYYKPAKVDPLEAFCSPFAFAKTMPEKLKVWGDYIRNQVTGPDSLHFYDYDGMRKNLAHDDTKGWYWQTCLELGYFQTAPRGKLPRVRSKYCDLKQQLGACEKIFGRKMNPSIAQFNRKHKGWNVRTSRIFYADGQIDPWRKLSVNSPYAPKRTSKPANPLFVIEKGSHCTDLGSDSPFDSKSLKDVRKSEVESFKKWML
ncbi:peptidase S28 [Basidiobolus meristosporus CBS 931.73]|uniref:Peptidase S28 n=1 Tax=Basidiobolus meristosporus CBS 931.73 TaxID=1314790 RepID=A0A1Y1Z2V3_9FUNG|nr:peptidase S28 [Basidiobolus meristosporus CBS 931.73]|eukprot:ORY04434.1 peptidase S28 [Basidiobolus meristosporus CBS 931.73]